MAIDMREKVQVVTETTGYHNEEVRIQHVNRNPESAEKKFEDLEAVKSFRKAWPTVTDDNYLTLFGFRRFRTAHLLNLRFLEKEVDQIDHQIFQSGLKLDHSPSTVDRLGLGYAKKDLITQGIDERINKELVMKLRELLKQYGI